jgi:hypothetical protein
MMTSGMVRVACIYCGLDNDWTPEIDQPLYDAGTDKAPWH